jgi:NAD(P)-dependent dehydrogenase (short-subunit alcohol dehydrogenase family)
MTPDDLSDATTIVVGASRGLGRGIATALANAGAPVIAVARTSQALDELADHNSLIRSEVADAADPTVPSRLIDRYEPRAIVVVAGATPLLRPLQQQTWETFCVNWHSDVRITFQWVREALLKPLRPQSKVIAISSGAALWGSSIGGGYAGAKATQRFITDYARGEADGAGLQIGFSSVYPGLTGSTDLGRLAVAAHAAQSGVFEEEFLKGLGEPLTPEIAGAALVGLVRADMATVAPGYRLSAAGLQDLANPIA